MSVPQEIIVDNFAGGGGASEGIEAAIARPIDYAINHDLTPRELYRAQSFRDDYIIAPEVNGKPLSKATQVRMCGNSVPPIVAEALVRSNLIEQRSREAA